VGRVLIVDDEPLLGRALSFVLSDAHCVDVVTSAKEALGRLRSGERYDVILSDIAMPDMNGIDFHEEVARTLPAQARRVVFVTGGVMNAAVRARVEASGRTVLEKPFGVDRLRAIVEALVAEAPSARAAAE
jgi:CheY-like chemotaxis protein